jgi:hypothetical protein
MIACRVVFLFSHSFREAFLQFKDCGLNPLNRLFRTLCDGFGSGGCGFGSLCRLIRPTRGGRCLCGDRFVSSRRFGLLGRAPRKRRYSKKSADHDVCEFPLRLHIMSLSSDSCSLSPP